MSYIETSPFRDKMSQPNVPNTETPKPRLTATPIEISTEIQQTSSLKSSVNEKQNFEKTKIAADNMSSIVKKSPKDKIFVSSSLWRNTTKTKTPKPQLRTPPIEISTELQRTSSLKSSVNEKQNLKKTKIAADNMSSIKKESSKDKIFVSSSLWRNTTKTKTPKPQLKVTPIEISTEMQQPSSSKSSWKVKREAEPTMFSIDNMSYIKEEPSEDKMPQSNPLWQNITEARTSKLQLRATPIEVSTEMQQPSSSKSSLKVEQEAEKTMFAVDNMSYIKKEPSEDKISQSNFLWRNTTEARTPKPQLKATLIETSTDIPRPSLLESSVKDKNAAKMETLLRVEANPSIKEDSVHDEMSLCTVSEHQTTKAEILNYIYGRKNARLARQQQSSSSKSPVEEKNAPKSTMFDVEKTSSGDESSSPSKFPRLDPNKAKIINYIFKPKNMSRSHSSSSESSVEDMETTNVV